MDKKCKICKSTENLEFFPLYGHDKIDKDSRNGIYFCKECLSVCETCEKCGKLKATFLMELFLRGRSENSFCQCEETFDEKEERFGKEEAKYEALQIMNKSEENGKTI